MENQPPDRKNPDSPSGSLSNFKSLKGNVGPIRGYMLFAPKMTKKMWYWCAGSVGNAGLFEFLGMFLLYYYNQILGLSAYLATIAIAISMTFDALSDPTIGYLSDRYRHPLGRRIPFMLAGVLPTGLCIILLFGIQLDLSQFMLFMQMTILTTLFRVAHTVYNVPREALALELYRDYDQRTALWSHSKIANIIGVAFVMAPILLFFMSEDWADPKGFIWSAIWVSAIFIGYNGYSSWRMRHIEREEKLPPNQIARPSLKELLPEIRSLVTNKSWLALFFAMIFFGLNGGLNGGSALYLNNFFWHWGPSDLFWSGFIQLPGAIAASLWILALIEKRFDKKQLAIYLALAAIVTAPILMGTRLLDIHYDTNILPPTGEGTLSFLWWLYCINAFIQNFLWTGFWILIASMFSDIVEDEQMKTQTRSEGLVFSANNLLNKLVANFGILASGFMLTWAGFDIAETFLEKEVAASYLALVFIISGAVAGTLSIFMILRYQITRSEHGQQLKNLGFSQETSSDLANSHSLDVSD